MTKLKTKENKTSVKGFIEKVKDEQIKKDCNVLIKLMRKITKSGPKMWGNSIVGFGNYHYKYASGREGDWMLTGFSPRKQALTIYTMCDIKKKSSLLRKLGIHKHSVSCIYVKKLDDIDLNILEKLIKESIYFIKKKYS
jgi:hypothetical protein